MDKQKDVRKLNEIINKPNIEAIIFDFDGVIVDLPIDYGSLRKELSRYFLSKHNFENSFNPLNANLELTKNKLGKKALYEAYKIIEKYEIKSLLKVKINREVINFIKTNSLHKKIALFSMNMRKTIEKFLIKNKLLKHINLIVAKDNVDMYKPNPEGILKILDNLNLKKRKVIFIGDKEVDLKTGESAAIKTFIISHQKNKMIIKN